MRIGINARLLANKEYTGIARSVYEIITVWMKNETEHEFFLFTNVPLSNFNNLPDNWHIVYKPFAVNQGILWDTILLPQLIRQTRVDAFWGTNFSLPVKLPGVRYFVTIYDLAAFRVKGVTEKKTALRLKIVERKACRRAEKIIAISNATAADITDLFKISPSKIAVSYCGGLPSDYQQKQYADGDVNEKLKFPEGFFLFISTIEPRKNIITIIKAFEKYVDATGSSDRLVLAGKIGWMCDDILKAAQESRYANRIIMPGFISEADKSYLLSNAKAFVYPSLYEGFGIPILEAFAYHIPVVTAAVSSMPEVGGDAAFYIDDPQDSDALAAQMRHTSGLTDAERCSLNEKMNARLAQFSWEKNAAEMMDIFTSKP